MFQLFFRAVGPWFSLAKMAEVGQRLCGGVHRLSGLRSGHTRPLYSGDSPGSLLGIRSVSESRVKEEAGRGRREVKPVSGHITTRSRAEQVDRSRRRKQQQQEGVSLVCTPPLELDSSRWIGLIQTLARVQAQTTHLYHPAGLFPVLQEKLLPSRMAPWSTGTVSIHLDTFRSHQQLRALCTVIFILAEQGAPDSPRTWRRLKVHPELTASTRSYSWRSDRSSSDAPLYQNKAAYYEILRVDLGATQSQIKTAYYKQSFIYHPDKNPGNKEALQHFSKISEAYTVLGNISLRKKYDRGLLNQVDVQTAGRPSSREAPSRSAGPPHQRRARHFHQAGGKTMFDFDAFYEAHYGEQLRREQDMKARRKYMQDMQKKNLKKWGEASMVDVTVGVLVTMGMVIFLQTLK